jgi:hypothetical protein
MSADDSNKQLRTNPASIRATAEAGEYVDPRVVLALLQDIADLEEAKARGELGLTRAEISLIETMHNSGPNRSLSYDEWETIIRIGARFKDVRSKLPDAQEMALRIKALGEQLEQQHGRMQKAEQSAKLAQQEARNANAVSDRRDEEIAALKGELKQVRKDLAKSQAANTTAFLSTVETGSDEALALVVRLLVGKLPKVARIAGTTALIGAATSSHVGIAYTPDGALRALLRKLMSGSLGNEDAEDNDIEEAGRLYAGSRVEEEDEDA